ncbi:MarR family regulator [Haloferax mucosum ATCC BAA-1512]|uniref:MarR family regulator n=1 Tax=Haloferax mucosum ATCC BAA-1512 TaxID=662479 RepID=M0IRM7_9EURY|nr:MarR family transcriptional regulator [Haloferax mucosum]ELZ98119.1 MarR family regulator [Haloferax mucosum ATCC BAA-1512]
MNFRALRNVNLVAAVVFIAATLTLAVQLLSPSPVVVSLGDNGMQTAQIGQYFTYNEVAVVVVAAVICGSSGTYLVLHDRSSHVSNRPHPSNAPHATDQSRVMTNGGTETVQADRERWESTAERLKNNEAVIYTALLEADGKLAQRKLVEETDLSKATVSRTLDKLENRSLVERKRSGMGNTVYLQ